jgi:hypothetical protein
MRPQRLFLACAFCLLLPAAASAQQIMQFSYAQIYLANTTVDLIPATSSGGQLNSIKCNFGGTTAVKLEFTIDGTASSFTVDPTYFERESSGAGQYLSGWILFLANFDSSIHVQLNNTGLGTSTINCWASWST